MGNFSQSKVLVAVGVGLSVSMVSGLSYLYYKYLKKEVIPTKWKKVGTLERLYFYPIKSCAGIELDSTLCENLGVLEGDIKDRALMLIQRSGQMLSARIHPKMFQIVPKIVSRSKLMISAPGMKDLEFDYSIIAEQSNGDTKAVMYGSKATVIDCGETYNKWFSDFILGQAEGLRLVYYPYPTSTRPVDIYYRNGVCTKQDVGALQDVSSYMLINNISVEELNSRLKDKVHPLQFRGNFYIKTNGPFDEDHWQWIKIGDDAIFRIVGPCYRCIMPNINPFSGERDPDGEPLKTLKTYRLFAGAPLKWPVMGCQMGLRAPGYVKSGDAIYAEERSQQ